MTIVVAADSLQNTSSDAHRTIKQFSHAGDFASDLEDMDSSSKLVVSITVHSCMCQKKV